MEGNEQYLSKKQHLISAGTLVLLLLTLFLAVKTIGEFKGLRFVGGGVPISNTITVQGEGEVFAVPDVATFSFSVIEESSSVEKAQQSATQKINIALELVRQAGIEEKDIKTLGYNVYPLYEFTREICNQFSCPPSKRELTGYEVAQTVEVKVRDTSKAGKILADVGTTGVSNISGLQFTIDDEEVLKREAREKAIDDAKAKAKALADDLDVRLVRIVSFSESGAYPQFLYRATFDSVSGLGTAVESAPEIPTGENKIISEVNITYEIR